MNKRRIILCLALMMVAISASAQLTDTIRHRNRCYYYSSWYDTCEKFINPLPEGINTYYVLSTLGINYYIDDTVRPLQIEQQYTEQRIKVLGLAAVVSPMGSIAPGGPTVQSINLDRLPEYMYLYQGTGSSNYSDFILIDSLRWDTVQPKTILYPRHHDTATYGFMSCPVYEVMFDKPVYVDSDFWIGGTFNSNVSYHNYADWIYPNVYYVSVRESSGYPCQCDDGFDELFGWPPDQWYALSWSHRCRWSCFFAITEPQHLVRGEAADSTTGEVQGSGYYVDSTLATLYPVPAHGYRFSHWDDGSTDNPRHLMVLQDTLLVAHFELLDTFYVRAATNNTAWGQVEGSGFYPEGTLVTLTAVPADNNAAFEGWEDGEGANPRVITLTQDTLLTAIFSYDSVPEGIDGPARDVLGLKISPNPVHRVLRVQTRTEVQGSLQVYDGKGRLVWEAPMEGREARVDVSRMAVGQYVLRVEGPAGSSQRKFVRR